jgi:hypothetical protein
MNKAWKVCSLVIFALMIASSLFLVKPSLAQSKPSVPEFTVSIDDHSYDVQTTTTTTTDLDGRRITTTTPGYHTANGTITISIKNQPFTPYYDSDGYPINLYYHIRVKDIGVNWLYYPGEGSSDDYFQASNATYTIVSFHYGGHSFEISWGHFLDLRPDGSMDFGVEAFIGHTKTYSGSGLNPGNQIVTYIGVTGGWSDTTTVTIPNAAYTPIYANPTGSPVPTAVPAVTQTPIHSSNVTPSGMQPASLPAELHWDFIELALLVVVGAVFVFLLTVILFMRRRIKALEMKQNGA